MTDAPLLSQRDIRDKLEELYRAQPERRKLVAFYGRGDSDTVETTTAGLFFVVPVASELDLREQLLKYDKPESHGAFLIPWSGDLPLDLAGRFVHNGRILRIGASARLATLFGARDVDLEALDSPLAAYLLRSANPDGYQCAGGRLSLDALWEAWLGKDLGVPVEGGLALDNLLAWAAVDTHGPKVVEKLSAPGETAIRAALADHLTKRLGPAGPVVWRAWETGRGRTALEFAILFEPLLASALPVETMWMRTETKTELNCADDALALEVARTIGQTAALALRCVEKRPNGVDEARAIVRDADRRSVPPEVSDALRLSTRLPKGWQARLDALGQILVDGAANPTFDVLQRAANALHELDRHSHFTDPSCTPTVKRAEMGVRLLAWLVARPDKKLEPPMAAHGLAEVIGRWYAEDGGYVDWARQRARGSADKPFGTGVQAVVAAADAARTDLDRTFTKSLKAWIEAGSPSSQALPIWEGVTRVAVKFLDGDKDRRLLVLLFDGMAWAQAVELFGSLGSQMAPWGPIAWHGSKEGRIGAGGYPVVFAALPTETETSRAAFFSGKPTGPGEKSDTAKDPERFAAHPGLRKYFTGAEVPRLLLRGEGHAQDGSASSQALALVRDTSRRIAAIVINAIDDSLKAGTQELKSWNTASIQSLPDLLNAAREAGRAVLIASDHGHVPGARLKAKGSYPNAGARWRPWTAPNESVAEYEMGFRGSQVHTPKGAHGVILVTDDASRYGAGVHAGEHGGGTLSEVVVPLVIIGSDHLGVGAAPDTALAARPAYVPDWWHYEVLHATGAAPAIVSKPRKGVLKNQLILTDGVEAVYSAAAAPAKPGHGGKGSSPPPNMDTPFAKSEMLAARAPKAAQRKQVVQAVDFLLARNGVASSDAFAVALGELAFRVPGLISTLQIVLNVDGYPVLTYDSVGKQVRLDREKLSAQFEVAL